MPNRLVLVLAVAGIVLGATPVGAQDTTEAVRDPELRAELLRRVADDQEVREHLAAVLRAGEQPDPRLVTRLMLVDSTNAAWIAHVVDAHGWPGPTAVGADGANAAFLLVQHTDRDTALQARALPLLERAYQREEATGQQVALLTDRLATARGQPQLYGTQASLDSGRVVFRPIADSAGVDARRAALGLAPLGEYRRMLESSYTTAGRP